MSAPVHDASRAPNSAVSDTRPWEGRAFGGIVLAAFLLYGVGSTVADRPVGITLVVVNSIAVAFAGLIGFRLVRSTDNSVGAGYPSVDSPTPRNLGGSSALAHSPSAQSSSC